MPYLALVWRREESPADALRMLILAHSVNAAEGYLLVTPMKRHSQQNLGLAGRPPRRCPLISCDLETERARLRGWPRRQDVRPAGGLLVPVLPPGGVFAPVAPMCANTGQSWCANCRQQGLVYGEGFG